MSLSISRRANPESKPPGRMNRGHLVWVEPLRPLDPLTMSSITAGSSPNSRPAISASELTSRCAADIRLFSALTTWPAPGRSPACTTLEPRTSSTGRTRALGARQHEATRGGGGGAAGGVVRQGNAWVAGEPPARRRSGVVDLQVIARAGEQARRRLAHVPQADEADPPDPLAHRRSPYS